MASECAESADEPAGNAVRKETFVFSPEEGVEGGLVVQAQQVRRNLTAVLARFGLTLDDALMVRVYLMSFDDFDIFNADYETWFNGPLPSRTCVGVSGLAVGASIEIDLIAGIREENDS